MQAMWRTELCRQHARGWFSSMRHKGAQWSSGGVTREEVARQGSTQPAWQLANRPHGQSETPETGISKPTQAKRLRSRAARCWGGFVR